MLASKRTRKEVGANAELVYVGERLVPKNLPYRIQLNTSGNNIGRGMQFRKSYDCASRPWCRTDDARVHSGNCNIYLDSEEQAAMVSKLHAKITFCPENNGWCLEDLESINGTLHNNTRVKSVTNMAGKCLPERKSEYARMWRKG